MPLAACAGDQDLGLDSRTLRAHRLGLLIAIGHATVVVQLPGSMADAVAVLLGAQSISWVYLLVLGLAFGLKCVAGRGGC